MYGDFLSGLGLNEFEEEGWNLVFVNEGFSLDVGVEKVGWGNEWCLVGVGWDDDGSGAGVKLFNFGGL